MNGHSIPNKLGPHDHEERIEHIQGTLVLHRDQTAVESTSELDHLGLLPGSIQLSSITSKLLTSLHGIGGTSLLQDVAPLLSKSFLKLVLRHRDLIRRQNGSLTRNSIVMLVDQLLIINRLSINVTFREDLDSRGEELLTDHVLSGGGVGMGLDKDEGGVLVSAGVGGGGVCLPRVANAVVILGFWQSSSVSEHCWEIVEMDLSR
mmetsp:Transcript_26626/g.41765  ORF Transcript_26626/g.41765 Transcript_26626/m.41765 type:complete len:205 (-) Transcript_26626:14-628(-)